jgi:DNA-binding GntR family transcriptional regulator
MPRRVAGIASRSRNLPELAYRAIRQEISFGRLAPGDRLTEAVLAEALGMSRTPVRESLLALAREGLILKEGRSFVLAPLTLEDVDEVREMRLLLEPAAIRRAVTAMNPSILAGLSRALLAQKTAHAASDSDAFIVANGTFRSTLLATISNRRLRRAIEMYGDHMHFLRVRLRDPRSREIVLKRLTNLLRAMRAGDAEGAVEIWSKHIESADASAREWVREMSERNTRTILLPDRAVRA